jgi:magnesium-transporting ATPase (P-type)
MDWHAISSKEVIEKLGSSGRGLSRQKVEDYLVKYGENKIQKRASFNALKVFLDQFKSFLIIILIIAAGISLIMDSQIDAIVILAIIVLNAGIGFFQEFKAEKAIEELKKMMVPTAKVLRDGRIVKVNSEKIVPGDILVLEEGDKIMADARILESNGLKVNEASLTGESVPEEKSVKRLNANIPLADRENMVFQGTEIVNGSGHAITIATGMHTEIGRISELVQKVKPEKNPFRDKLDIFARKIGIIILILSAIIIAILLFAGAQVIQSFLVAVSLAVSAIPEGLPAVISLGLALATRRMIKKNVLIRKLPASETLGRTTHICVPGDTLVFGNSSIKKIKEIKEKDKVLGIDGNYSYVNKLFKRKYSGDMVFIKPVGLPEIKFTPNHPILVSEMIKTRPSVHTLYPLKRPRITKLSKPEWIPAGKVTKNHVVLVPRLKKEEDFFLDLRIGRKRENKKILFDSELAELFGWYLAEGCCSSSKGSHYVVFYLGKHEKENAERLKYLIEKKFGLKSYLSEARTSLRLVAINGDLVNFLKKEFCNKAINKRIPDFVMNAKEENIISFIRGYLKGDGTISKNILSLRFSTTSKILAYQLILLLNKIGIKGKLYKNKRRKIHFIEGRKVKCNDSYTIIVNGTQAEKIHPIQLKKRKRNLDLFDDNFVYYTIRKIYNKYETLDVYNIETESQSYCLPFIVHNCTDKTGTLTEEKMKVSEIYANNQLNPKKGRDLLLKIGVLCNKASRETDENGAKYFIGDPTEVALIVSAENNFLDKKELEKKEGKVKEFPFSSERKMMSIVRKRDKRLISYVKGAPEKILENCTYQFLNGSKQKLFPDEKKKLYKAYEDMAKKGLRVLGFAYKEFSHDKEELTQEEAESGLIFVGFQGMIDPPRQEVRPAIKICNEAGIKVIMITGDSKLTAEAVAKEIGLKGKSIDSVELKKLSDKQLYNEIEKIAVFSRISPEDKLRIINILKQKNEIVAMTGDGVNDALALKRADIGISMGVRGTDVARNSSDIVLVDDNFASIVEGVREGRRIFDNVKKFVKYLLAANFYEVFFVLSVILIFRDPNLLPLLPLQILWINLVTDSFPALALSTEAMEKDVMKRRPSKKGVLQGIKGFILLSGIIGLIIIAIAFFLHLGDIDKARTMAVTTSVVYQMLLVFNCKTEKSVFKSNFNKYLVYAVAFSIILHLLVVYTGLNSLFHFTSLGAFDWVKIIVLGLAGFLTIEIFKIFKGKK